MKTPAFLPAVMAAVLTVSAPLLFAGEEDRDPAIQLKRDSFQKIVPRPNPETGRPQPFTVTLNSQDAFTFEGKRYSGFRFIVSRPNGGSGAERAEDQHLVWYFFMPPVPPMLWYITKSEGKMNGFRSFIEIDAADYEGLTAWPPQDKTFGAVQTLSGETLIEGEEYIIWFNFPEDYTKPVEITACLGYKKGDLDFETVEAYLGLKRK